MNQSGLPFLDIASTASSSSLYTNLNEPSCSTSYDGDEETDEIIQVDKLTSTDNFEILWEEQKTLKQRQKIQLYAYKLCTSSPRQILF